MPKIPTYDAQISPSRSAGPPGIGQQIYTSPWGKSLQRLGQLIYERSEQLQLEKDTAQATEAFMQFSNQWRQFERDELRREGTQTFDNQDRANKMFETASQQVAKGLSSRASQVFTQKARQIYQGTLDTLSRHEITERNKVRGQTVDTNRALVEQAIISDAPLETFLEMLYGNPETETEGFLDVIDTMYPGYDTTEQKVDEELALIKKFLTQKSISSPEMIHEYVAQFDDALPESEKQLYLKKGEIAQIRRIIRVAPESLQESIDRFKYITDDEKEQFLLAARSEAERRFDRAVRLTDRREQQIKEAEQERRDEIEFDWIKRYNRGETNLDELEVLAQHNMIDREMYERYAKPGEIEDNLVVYDQLSTRAQKGETSKDLLQDLKQAHRQQDLSDETYLQMKKGIMDEGAKRAWGRLRAAFEPGLLRTPDKGRLWESAQKEYQRRLNQKIDPNIAVDEVIALFLRQVPRSIHTLPVISVLGKRPENMDDINKATLDLITKLNEATPEQLADPTFLENLGDELRYTQDYADIFERQQQMQEQIDPEELKKQRKFGQNK